MADKSAHFASSEQWRRYGEIDPYYGVSTKARYRKDMLDDHVRAEFFESGRLSVSQLLTLLDEYVPTDRPLRRVLDFGCGPGRLVLAFAPVAEDQVLGVDVSPAMLAETSRNAAQAELTNVQTCLTDELGQDDVEFDLVHSASVFQHIRPGLGQPLICSLLRRVRPGGRVALHVTTRPATIIGRAFFFAVLRAPFLARMWNLVRRRPWNYPLMEMHSYDIDTLVRVFAEEGFAATVVVPISAYSRTDYLSVWLLSQRRSSRGA
jgi:SAM-dependent methyltransferase